ncbi:hypothetical protein KP509_28G045000 [Ceratopteris richardii]|nr:hypothetical protein KP509_28G045000 [Ceratopteris richardii]
MSAPDLGAHSNMLQTVRFLSIRRRQFRAKAELDDAKQKHHAPSNKGFGIRVPTMPDIESARRLLESAFQALSFDMRRIPIDTALQGLPSGISKSVQVLVFDITGFVVTRLRKAGKKELDDIPMDKNQYPRCSWPRTLKSKDLNGLIGVGLSDEGSSVQPLAPRCAWPRTRHGAVELGNFPSSTAATADVVYPHSAWPRKSLPANHAIVANEPVASESMKVLSAEDDVCVIEGGARCAWPRKGIPAKQSHYTTEDVSGHSSVSSSAGHDGAPPAETNDAGLPRRMLATSVGLTMLDQITKGSMVTSMFDFCSSLPAGPLEMTEDDVGTDVGRRTLLVLIKGPGG